MPSTEPAEPLRETNKRAAHCNRCRKLLLPGEGIKKTDHCHFTDYRYVCENCEQMEPIDDRMRKLLNAWMESRTVSGLPNPYTEYRSAVAQLKVALERDLKPEEHLKIAENLERVYESRPRA